MKINKFLFATFFAVAIISPSVGLSRSSRVNSEIGIRQPRAVLTRNEEQIQKTLTRKERRELRHEKKSMQEFERRRGGGIYISVGAVILIVILILIL
jgi:hypothetical protein